MQGHTIEKKKKEKVTNKCKIKTLALSVKAH